MQPQPHDALTDRLAVAKLLADAERAGHPEQVDEELMERAERADAKRARRAWAPCTQAYPDGIVDWENESRLRTMCGASPLRAPLKAAPRRALILRARSRLRCGGRPRTRGRSRAGASRDGPDEPEPAEGRRHHPHPHLGTAARRHSLRKYRRSHVAR